MKKDPQSVAQNKRAESYQYEFNNAQTKWQTEMKQAEVAASHKIEAIKLAIAASERGSESKAILDYARDLEAYLTEEINQIEFVPPKNPAESNIVTL